MSDPERQGMGARSSALDVDLQQPSNRSTKEPEPTTHSMMDHKRPLPPLESRDAIKAKVKSFARWLPLSTNSDILIATSEDIRTAIQNQSCDHAMSEASAANQLLASYGKLNSRKLSRQYAPATIASPPQKKRRLLLSDEAVRTAATVGAPAPSDEQTPTPNTVWGTEAIQNGGLMCEKPTEDTSMICGPTETSEAPAEGPEPGVAMQSLKARFDDEGYRSWTTSPKDIEDAGDEAQEKLVKHLAQFQQKTPLHVPPQVEEKKKSFLGLGSLGELEKSYSGDFQAARDRMLAEQKAGEERSRLLRDRALSKKGADSAYDNPRLPSTGFPATGDSNQGNDEALMDLFDYDATDSDDFAQNEENGENDPSGSTHHSLEKDEIEPGDMFRVDRDFSLETELDYAEEYITQKRCKDGFLKSQRPRRVRHRRGGRHPTSRAAAERYRTQSRHISVNHYGAASNFESGERCVKENRLRNLTAASDYGDAVSNTISSSSNGDHDFERLQKLRFHGIHKTPVSRPSLKMMAMSKSSDSVEAGHPSVDTLPVRPLEGTVRPSLRPGNDIGENETLNRRPLSGLETLAQRAMLRDRGSKSLEDRSGEEQPPSNDIGRDALGIEQLTCPSNFHNFPAAEREAIVAHERVKEQQRDLKMLKLTTAEIAKLDSLADFNETEFKEVREVQKFAGIVIDLQMPGKFRRKRIAEIRDNMKRRIDRWGTPTNEPVENHIAKFLTRDQMSRLECLLRDVEQKVEEFGLQRSAGKEKRSKMGKMCKRGAPQKKQEKKVHSLTDNIDDKHGRIRRDIPDGAEFDLDGPSPKLTATENRRNAQYAYQDRKIAEYRDRLRQFDDMAAEHSAIVTGQLPPPRAPAARGLTDDTGNDSESEVSEEDEGEASYFGPGRGISGPEEFTAQPSFPPQLEDSEQLLDIEEINRLEQERQDHAEAAESQRAPFSRPRSQRHYQKPDLGLIQRMRERQSFGHDLQGEPILFADLLEEPKNQDSSESDSNSDAGLTKKVNRYRVNARFVGVEIYSPEVEYRLKDFFSLAAANAHVSSVIQSTQAQWSPTCGNEQGRWELHVKNNSGLVEQILDMGENNEVQVRVWVDKDVVEVDLGRKACNKARRQKLKEVRPVFVVDWEKTVTTTIPPIVPVLVDARRETSGQPVKGAESLVVMSSKNGHECNGITEQAIPASSLAATDSHDDLFGPSRSPSPVNPHPLPSNPRPPNQSIETNTPVPTTPQLRTTTMTTTTTTKTSAPSTQLTYFSDAVHANRYAKSLFLSWYNSFLPLTGSDPRNSAWRRQVDEALELELARLGDWGLWEGREELVRSGVGFTPGKGEADGDGDDDGDSSAKRVKEAMRVWVRKIAVKGPGN